MRRAEIGGALRRVRDERADALGREVGLERRRRKLSGGRCVRALVSGWLAAPDATPGLLAGVRQCQHAGPGLGRALLSRVSPSPAHRERGPG